MRLETIGFRMWPTGYKRRLTVRLALGVAATLQGHDDLGALTQIVIDRI